ncbi:MAG: tetratricopeptide repeat protein [Terriglobus roseus]|nr:tetratricopeptide repeat protein [Terriglobus roseus]
MSLEAVAFSAQQQSDAALGAFQRALTHCPAYLPALEGAAQIQFARKSPAAVPLLERIVTQQPTNVPAHAMLATTLAAQRNCKAALPHFATAEPAMRTHPELQQSYGSCLADTGDLAAALVQYQELAAAHPSDAAQYDIAVLQWRGGRGQEALRTLDPLLSSGQFEPAFSLGSRVAESLGDTAHAVAWLRQAILLSPENVDNYVAFANLAFIHSSFQVGIDVLNAGLQRLPSAAPLLVARGVLEVQISQQPQAIADFEQAHKLDPQLSLSVDALGIVQSQQHQDKASLDLFRKQAQQHPDDAVVQYLLAEQLGENENTGTDDLNDAIAAAKRATALDPQYQPAHDLLAKLYLRAGEPKLAIAQANLALAQDPNDQEALYQQLMASRRSGDTAAIKSLVDRLQRARAENERKQHGCVSCPCNTDRSHRFMTCSIRRRRS